MKQKHNILYYLLFVICFSFMLALQISCGSDSNNNTTTGNSTTPEAYVPTGFPQVVIVSGTNYEMGVQYGEQTAPAVYHNIMLFKSALDIVVGDPATVTTDMRVWDYYLKLYDLTLKDWLDGILQGCANKGYTVSYLDLILLMVYPTELWARPTAAYPTGFKSSEVALSQTPKSYHSCNSLAATGTATSDGKTIHAIDQMAGIDMMENIILIAFPSTGYSFVAQGYAGRVNANSAMNSNGFAWTMTAIMSDSPAWGLTEVYFHYLAQIASSRADAVTYLQNTPRGGVAGGFILSDTTGVGVFETAPDNGTNYAQRSTSSGFVVQTNHLVDGSLAAFNPVWLEPALGTFTRYNTVFQYLTDAGAGGVDPNYVKMVFASDDWYDLGTITWHHNDPGAPFLSNDHTSISESIFIPEDLIAYFGTGTPSGNGFPAYATGEYVKIQLLPVPGAVSHQADVDTLAYFWRAADFLEEEMHESVRPAYLTLSVIESVQEKLDKAISAYSVGIDRAAYAYFETDIKKQNTLYGAALTGFAKAQMYAQMAYTTLIDQGGVDN
jgi:hypothetical protein